LMKAKFVESIAGQSELMDKLGRQLITIELAIPSLYATVLKLVAGKDATITVGSSFYLTFGCWFVALLLTLASLFPRDWKVDTSVIKRDPTARDADLGIEDFFRKSAVYKRRLLAAASLLFFGGVVAAAWSIFP